MPVEIRFIASLHENKSDNHEMITGCIAADDDVGTAGGAKTETDGTC